MAENVAPEGTVIKKADGTYAIKRGGQWMPAGRMYAGPAPKLEATERKALGDYRAGAQRAGEVMIDLERFGSLNRQQGSGGVLGLPVIRDIHGMVNPMVGEMNAITNRLTPGEREAGSGAMSDKDVEMYRSAVPGQGYTGETNKNLRERRKAGAIRTREHAAFMDYYARVNGTLNGAQELWDEYKDAEPVYDPQKGVARQARPWRDYFGVGGGAPAAPATRAGQTVTVGGKSYSVRVKGQ